MSEFMNKRNTENTPGSVEGMALSMPDEAYSTESPVENIMGLHSTRPQEYEEMNIAESAEDLTAADLIVEYGEYGLGRAAANSLVAIIQDVTNRAGAGNYVKGASPEEKAKILASVHDLGKIEVPKTIQLD